MEQEKITVGFHYIDTWGNEYSQESVLDAANSDSELDIIGEQFDCFLSQCGYIRNGYTILTESLTDEEVEELEFHLHEYRAKKGKGNSEDSN